MKPAPVRRSALGYGASKSRSLHATKVRGVAQTATVRRLDKATEDRLVAQSAAVTKRCAPEGPDSLAVLVGRHKSQPSRWMKGDRNSPTYRAFEFVVCTSRGETTSPYPFLTELKNVAIHEHLETRETEWLLRRWHQLQSDEVRAEGREKRASQLGFRATYRQALLDEAAIQVELAAIDEVLEARDINPRGEGR